MLHYTKEGGGVILHLNIYEMFAGVGGFRVGFERGDAEFFRTVLANQWEPGKKNQFAYDCYAGNFPDSLTLNKDVHDISKEFYQGQSIDLVVGGHPCQSFSVAATASTGTGLDSDKGELYWEVARALEQTKAPYFLIENVDRMLKSPTKQRGRDFRIMLEEYNRLGYVVEWRVINAAEYGMTQRRRRVFLLGYHKTTAYAQSLSQEESHTILASRGIFAQAFPHTLTTTERVGVVSDTEQDEAFLNSGVMRGGQYLTVKSDPIKEEPTPLSSILEPEVDEGYYLTAEKEARFSYLRGPKKFDRVSKEGHSYVYSEGGMSPYDSLELPARTILTSEGNVSRTTHIIKDPHTNRLRYLTPLECERAMMFPDNWTSSLTKRQRYFTMGNAIVTGVVTRFSKELKRQLEPFLTDTE